MLRAVSEGSTSPRVPADQSCSGHRDDCLKMIENSNEEQDKRSDGASQNRDADLQQRFDRLSKALEREKPEQEEPGRNEAGLSGIGLAMRLGSEMEADVSGFYNELFPFMRIQVFISALPQF